MQFSRDGAQIFPAAFSPDQIDNLKNAFASVPHDRAGVRLKPLPDLPRLLGPADAVAHSFLGREACAVRAVLFDKTPDRNWALGWHQDRTIAVRKRRDIPDFTDWTVKSGIHHVIPPFDYLERMLTLRIHLDPVNDSNAPLLIAPGTHSLGRINETEIPAVVERFGTAACLAEAGDAWLYSTPILHASKSAAEPARRRVLQLYYATDGLPGGLEWLGV